MNVTSALFALIGTLVGGSITLIATWIQNKNQITRDYIKIAHDLAKEDYNKILSFSKPGQIVLPIESFMTYYLKYIKIIQNNNFKLEDLNELKKFRNELNEFYLKDNNN
ncbi:MAG: hypothetical protein ABJA35_05595 [Parafilimonas sp.]